MRHVAAYMLATLGGYENPTAQDISKILSSVGIEADKTRLEALCAELNGKNVDEVVAGGMSKLASMPAAGAAPAAGGAPAAAAAPAKEEAKGGKAAKKEEPKEESDEEMGFGLFD